MMPTGMRPPTRGSGHRQTASVAWSGLSPKMLWILITWSIILSCPEWADLLVDNVDWEDAQYAGPQKVDIVKKNHSGA
jgi:hypothetical protein